MIYSYFRVDDQPLQPEAVTGGEDHTRLPRRPEWPPESRTESACGATSLFAKALTVPCSTLEVLKRPGSKRQGSKLWSWKPLSPKPSRIQLQGSPEQLRSYYSTDLPPRLLRVCARQPAHRPVSPPLPLLAP